VAGSLKGRFKVAQSVAGIRCNEVFEFRGFEQVLLFNLRLACLFD
jgi:hypothetical protein